MRALALLFVSGCSTILGIDDLRYVGGDASADANASDGGAEAEASSCNGHDCLGGACSNGVCQPVLVMQTSSLQPTLATDGVNVFFRDASGVKSCAVSGCANATPMASAASSGVVGVSTTRVYWSETTTIRSCAKTACTPSTLIDLGALGVTGMAASTESSFVFAAGSAAGTLGVWRAGLDGSGLQQVISQSIASSTSGAVASPAGSQRAYWAQIGTPAISYCDATCGTTPDATTIAMPVSAQAMVATSQAVFVATANGVFRTPAALTPTPTGFAGSAQVRALALSTSGATLYFAEMLSGSTSAIRSCAASATTCSPTDVHLASNPITALAVDDVAMYWVEGTTAIWRLAL